MVKVSDYTSERKIKRIFRAKRKLNVAGLVSHITQRAAGKEPLFIEETDYLQMLVFLRDICRRYGITVFVISKYVSTLYPPDHYVM